MKKFLLLALIIILSSVMLSSCGLIGAYREYVAVMNEGASAATEVTTTTPTTVEAPTYAETTEPSTAEEVEEENVIFLALDKLFNGRAKASEVEKVTEPSIAAAKPNKAVEQTTLAAKPTEAVEQTTVAVRSAEAVERTTVAAKLAEATEPSPIIIIEETTANNISVADVGDSLGYDLYFDKVSENSGKLTYFKDGVSFSRILANFKDPKVVGKVNMKQGNNVIILKDGDSYWSIDASTKFGLECFKILKASKFPTGSGNYFEFDEQEVSLHDKYGNEIDAEILPGELIGSIANSYSINHTPSGKYLINTGSKCAILSANETRIIITVLG